MVLPDRTLASTAQEHLDDHNGEIQLYLVAMPANTQTGNYTLVLSDSGKVIEMNNASALTLTVPTNASVAFELGTVIEVWQQGAGQITVAGAGVTFRNPSTGGLKTASQYSSISLRKRATDEWAVEGGIA